MEKIYQSVPIKKKITNEERLILLGQIVEANKIVKVQVELLEDYKEKIKGINKIIDEQHGIMSQCATDSEQDFVIKNIECYVTYHKGIATFTNTKTGEVEEERPITEEEQLALSENRVDAESIIRQASKEEDE